MTTRERIEQALTFDTGCEPSAQEIIDALNRAGYQITPQAGEAEPTGWLFSGRHKVTAARTQFLSFTGDAGTDHWPHDQWTEFSYEPLFRRPPASAWMPIETAPRDGTLILTAGQTRGVNLSYWLDNNDTEYPWAGWRSLERVEVAHADKLTHWQPLPPPPDSPGAPAKTLDQWHEDFGPVVWFCWDSDNKRWLGEPAWIGTPNDDSWPEYHTHWIPHPDMPPPPDSPGSTEES